MFCGPVYQEGTAAEDCITSQDCIPVTCPVTCGTDNDMPDSMDLLATYTGLSDSLIHLVSL